MGSPAAGAVRSSACRLGFFVLLEFSSPGQCVAARPRGHPRGTGATCLNVCQAGLRRFAKFFSSEEKSWTITSRGIILQVVMDSYHGELYLPV